MEVAGTAKEDLDSNICTPLGKTTTAENRYEVYGPHAQLLMIRTFFNEDLVKIVE